MVPKLLLQWSVRELYNSLVSDPNNGSPQEARDEEDNIIISDSTLRMLLPKQKKMSARYKVMCGCECCISAKSIHSSWLSWRDINSKIKEKIQDSQIRRSDEKAHSHIINI